jgi:hypothetical protein
MPFTTSESRRETDLNGPKVVGDRCFLHYRKMLRKYRSEIRWRTIHAIKREVMEANRDKALTDDLVAMNLAWDVFCHFHAMPYESCKRTENGEVDY